MVARILFPAVVSVSKFWGIDSMAKLVWHYMTCL